MCSIDRWTDTLRVPRTGSRLERRSGLSGARRTVGGLESSRAVRKPGLGWLGLGWLGLGSFRGSVRDEKMSIGRRAAAFTLVELLLVIAILVALASMVVVAAGSIFGSTKERATRAQLERLTLLIEEYRSRAGQYPPDGIDAELRTADGQELRGSAALYHALTSPIDVLEMRGGVPRKMKYDPIVDSFPDRELSPTDASIPGVREILDAFGTPFHYDRVSDAVFRPQSGEVHYPPIEGNPPHPEDPRTLPEELGGVKFPGRAQSPNFDLWSHGADGHDPPDAGGKPLPVIATWNLKD
jgi:type II secretory pathway pseudopilin PulG